MANWLRYCRIILVMLLACAVGWSTAWPGIEVSKVIDGDTIVLNTGQRVRYVRINTPEVSRADKITRAMAERAKAYNEGLVLGKDIRLEYDVEKQDHWGRLLAYVYVGNLMVNAEMVSAGYASASPHRPNVKYASLFKKLEQEARHKKKGLWQCE